MFSEKFVARLRTSPTPMGELAEQVGLDRFTLSRFLTLDACVKARDPRLLRLGALVGLDSDAVFAEPKAGDRRGKRSGK